MRRILAGVCAAALTLGGAVAMADSTSDQGMQDQQNTQGQQSDQGVSGQNQGLSGQSQGQSSQYQGQSGQGVSGTEASQQYLGKVKSVDLSKHQLTIELPLAPDAQVMRNGHQASLNEVKRGDDVRVDFQPTSKGVTKIDAQSKDMIQQKTPTQSNP
jgi:hypothetical protein